MCASILAGKVWAGEGEEVVWTVQITEGVKEKVKGALGTRQPPLFLRARAPWPRTPHAPLLNRALALSRRGNVADPQP